MALRNLITQWNMVMTFFYGVLKEKYHTIKNISLRPLRA